jgi:hypothetical protein
MKRVVMVPMRDSVKLNHDVGAQRARRAPIIHADALQRDRAGALAAALCWPRCHKATKCS